MLEFGSSDFHPISICATITCIVAVGAPVSGAHYNPSLTAGFWLVGDRCAPSAWMYMFIVSLSAILAHFLAYGLDYPLSEGNVGGLPTFPDLAVWIQAIFAEIIGTYFAIFMVLYTAKACKSTNGSLRSRYGWSHFLFMHYDFPFD